MTAILEIRRGDEVREYALAQATVAIGRATDNQIVLNDPMVSRHHARLEWVTGVWHISDLGSGNGTHLNDGEIEPKVPRPLQEGDIIRIGSFTLTLHVPPAPEDVTLIPTLLKETLVPQAETLTFTAPAVPRLVVTTPQGTQEFALDRETLILGRDPASDMVVDDRVVSRRHAQLQRVAGGYEITDLGSANGLTFQAARVPKKLLADGDALWIAQTVSLTYKTVAAIEAPLVGANGRSPLHALRGRVSLTLGRGSPNDIPLDHPAVSRRHARIARLSLSGAERDGDYVIEDLGSTNGTFVNGERVVESRPLRPGDTIRVGPIKFVFAPEALEQVDESHDLRLDALHLNHFIGKGINLLQDISLSIHPREFVAIVGVSGAGKSTLLDALNGFRPAREGAVLVNGTNLYRNFDAYRTELGYVPQEDIIHKELTVYQALDYAARLRLPADTTPAERRQRVMQVLETLDITERKDVPIHKLSGGQRKRVSIGVELLTRPGLFFLDEATSGLDPGTESQLMRLLRRLADQGHTILLITHATKNVMLCDQVAFLAKGGHLAYYGPPEEALAYFAVQDFDAIYEKLENERTPQAWAEKYRQSAQYQKFVVARLQEKYGALVQTPPPHSLPRVQGKGTGVTHVSAPRQLAILSSRNISILLRDKVSLALMLLIAPLIGALDFVTWKKGLFATQGGNATQSLTMLFMMGLICILVGAIASMREIVKEAEIYRRERMVTLKIAPYVLSKIWVGVLLALYQAAVFILTKKLAADWPDTPETMLTAYVTLVLATLSGMLMGLLISAVSPNQNVAPLLLIVVLVPQFMFAGGMLPLSTFGPAGQVISYVTTTKWAFESLVTISGLGREVAEDACWQLSKTERDALTEQDKVRRCTCMGPNAFQKCDLPGLRDLYDPAVDAPEPVQPSRPGNPPSQPIRPSPPATPSPDEQRRYQEELQRYQQALEQYQKDIEGYQTAARKYQEDIEVWRVRYQDWKEKHDKAIGEAEGLIKKIYDDFGTTFKVNLVSHWGWLSAIMVALFGLVLVVQRWKDMI
jgi:ABC-type multidrug transport system ATPase subunit